MPFQSQNKAKAVTAGGDATQAAPTQSSPADEALEGKLLDDIEFGTIPLSKRMSKTSKPRSKAPLKARATTRNPTVPRKTLQKLPSLPSSSPRPVLDDEDEVCAVTVDLNTDDPRTPSVAKKAAVSKKKEEKVVVRAQPSFDMDAIMNTTKSKPPIVYKNKSQAKRASQDDDDEEGSVSDDDQAENDSGTLWKKKDDEGMEVEVEVEVGSSPTSKTKAAPKASGKSKSKPKPKPKPQPKKKTTRAPTQSRVPVIELSSKRSSLADLPVSLQESEDSTPGQEMGIENDQDPEVVKANAVDKLETTRISEEEIPTAIGSPLSPKVNQVIEPPISDPPSQDTYVGRPSRAAKSRGTKRLAAYNLDELDADSGGTAGVVLEEMLSPVKKSRRSGPAPNSIKTSISAKTNTKGMDDNRPDVEEPRPIEVVLDLELETQPEVDELANPGEQDQEEVSNDDVEMEQPIQPTVSEPGVRKSASIKAIPPTKTETTPRPKTMPKPRKSIKQTDQDMITPSTPVLEHEAPALTYDKDLILRMIVAKLESNKTCDWYELAIQLNGDGFGGVLGFAKKAKRGKKMSENKVTGDDLYELYHRTVLPALKVGKALWIDSPVDNVPSSPSDEVVTPPSQDVEMSDCESEEGAPMPPPTKTKATRARG